MNIHRIKQLEPLACLENLLNKTTMLPLLVQMCFCLMSAK